MKRLTVCLVALFAILVPPVLAEDGADHPLIGRFEGAQIHHQEVSRFGEYTIAVGEEETQTVEGEVWMTLYDAPDDSSTFSIYSTYLSFLEQEGFEILLSYKPGEAPGGYLRGAYERAAFADHGNYNHSAPITNGNDGVAAYISARQETPDGNIYVSIAIAAGWYAYPQYKLDVVETRSDSGRIVSSGTRPAETADADQPAPAAAAPAPDGKLFSGTGSFRLRAGMSGFMFLDPAFAGELSVTEDGGPDVEVSNDGYKNVYGPFVEVAWFLNRNVGLALDVTRVVGDEEFTSEGVTYRSYAELALFRLSALSRMVGSDFPSTIGLGFGGGLAIVNLGQGTQGGTDDWRIHGEAFLPVFGTSLDMTIPVFGFAHVTAGFQYLFIPFTMFTLSDSDGPYTRTYHEGNLGGLTLRIGLVAEF